MPALGDLDWGDEVNDNTEMLESCVVQILKGNQVASGLVPSDGGGLQVDYTAGTVVVNSTEYSITASNKTCTGAQKNWLYVDSAGAVQISTVAPSGQFAMIAMVDAAAGTIERIADMRNLAESILSLDIDYTPDNYTPDTSESSEIEQHLAGIDNQFGIMAGFKNKLINGKLDWWARGGTETDNDYSADRWYSRSSGTTHSVAWEDFAFDQTDVPCFPTYYHRTVVTSSAGSSNYSYLQQAIEGVNTLSGETVTFSFWAKADASKNISVNFYQYFGSGGTPSATVNGINPTTCALTTAWQKFTITTTLPSISGKTLGTDGNDFLAIRLWYDAGSSFDSRTNSLGQQSGTFDVALLQIEKGSDATSFDDRPITIEQLLCQRYYQSAYGLTVLCLEQATYGSVYRSAVMYPVPMRTEPSITIYNVSERGSGFNDIVDADVTLNQNRYNGFRWQVTATNNDTAGAAEVSIQWKANAELYET
jgi:hypothetical protein